MKRQDDARIPFCGAPLTDAPAADALCAAPLLPPRAERVEGVERHAVDLDERSGDGTWEFLMESPREIPLPGAAEQDFDFSRWGEKDWRPAAVPGELAMQGFDIENNTEYYYRRRVEIPADYAGKRVIVRFDGVYGNARVWADGRFVRSHTGGFTSFDCDVTPFAAPGGSFLLTVGVADLEGDVPGTYNPDGKRTLGDPSWASFYAHHNIGGILRDVTLAALPQDFVARLHAETCFDAGFRDAVLSLSAQLRLDGEEAELRCELLDKEGSVAARGALGFSAADRLGKSGGLTRAQALELAVSSPLKWDAEHPNLYTLRASLFAGGAEREVCEQKIGFREIQFGGRRGTAPNQIYVNGRPVKLRGTCRHDVSPRAGRSTTPEEDWEEIRTYKRMNINHIRTSHYPASRHLLEACDALGMYVEQENAACFQGANGYEVHCGPQDFLGEFTEMIERDRNHPCILIWSLGNESGFEETAGYRMEYEYVKSVDPTRPVIFSYPFTVGSLPLPYDILSRHYEWVSGPLGHPALPVLHDEYAHVPCYNLETLRRDPNVRNFWGKSIRTAWDRIFRTDGALGGDIWGGIDDVFFLPEGVRERRQRHAAGRAAGYGPWGSVLDAYRRLKPEAYLTKKAYSPVRLREKECRVEDGLLLIPVENRFDHTDFRELTLLCRADGGPALPAKLPELPPHGEGTLALRGDWKNAKRLLLQFSTADGMIVEETLLPLRPPRVSFGPADGEAPRILQDERTVTVAGGGFSFVFERRTAQLTAADFAGSRLLTGGPRLQLGGVRLGAWKPEGFGFAAAMRGARAEVTLQGAYENGQRVRFTLGISGSGVLTAGCLLLNCPQAEKPLFEAGIAFDLPEQAESVSWLRDGLYSLYPPDHIGRSAGTALRRRKDARPGRYGKTPGWSWKDDMHDDFVDPEDAPVEPVTRDFRAMRENIRFYEVAFPGTAARVRAEADGGAAARMETEGGMRLIVDTQWCYPDIDWGNESGRPVRLSPGSYLSAVLRLTDREPEIG